MVPKKRSRTSASSSNPSSELEQSFSECFQNYHSLYHFNSNFASKCVWESRKVDVAMLETISFFSLPILQSWGWMAFLNISLPTYLNLVRAFYSNAKLEHDESGDTIIVITSFLMGTSIRLTIEEFGDYLHLLPKGSSYEKGHYNPTLFIPFELTSELNLHDRVLHLIVTWNLRPIKKHVKLRNIDYQWLDYFKFDRCPNLTLIIINDITKAIGRGINIYVTLPHGTYLSYLFRQLSISTYGDTPVTSNQPISYGTLHHAGYHFDANIGMQVKSHNPAEHADDGINVAFEDIPAPEHASPLASSLHAA